MFVLSLKSFSLVIRWGPQKYLMGTEISFAKPIVRPAARLFDKRSAPGEFSGGA
jgi:hypothetical protein